MSRRSRRQNGWNGTKIRRGKILWTHRLRIKPERIPVLLRDPGLVGERTLYNVGLLVPVDHFRMGQHQKVKAGHFCFRRWPPRSLIAAWRAILALSLIFATFVGDGNKGRVVSVKKLFVGTYGTLRSK